MARGVEPQLDAEPGTVAPRANPALVGHESAERELRRLDEAGRLPHAILLSGRRGIGKATLAFRLARFLLAKSAGSSADMFGDAVESGLMIRGAVGCAARLSSRTRARSPVFSA